MTALVGRFPKQRLLQIFPAMPKAAPSFKINSRKAKKPPRVKVVQKPARFSLPNLKNKVEILENPIQSESDKKEYKVIRLDNGLKALLISDVASMKNKSFPLPASSDDDSEDEEDETEEDSGDDSMGSGSDPDSRSPSKSSADPEEEKMAACALCVGVGSFSDPPDIQGMAHFVEHMVFMGSEKYPKENDFDAYIKKKGGSDNASTDCEVTTFYLEIQENHLAEAMDKFCQFFVSPLMKQETMQRERMAIDSEFTMAQPSDSHRREQLLASFLPEGHPSRQFLWGDSRSLAEPRGPADPELYRRAHAFRERHYSAHRMTVSVQARLPMETLENYVINTFGLVPTNKLPPDDQTEFCFKQEMVTPNFHAFYYVKPINHISELNVTWIMKSFLKDYKEKPQQYVSWIIGHEGDGSLISYLRKKVWALGLYAGSENGIDHSSLLCFLNIVIVLTQEGLNNIDKVLDALFGYLNMLREKCPDERLFNEIQRVEEINFRFLEEPQPCDNVEDLVERMHFYPPEHYLTGATLFYDYNPEAVKYILDCMTPETVNLIVHSDNHAEKIVYDQVEEWFGTEYKKMEISASREQEWRDMAPDPSFHLPVPNVFIPDNFDLIPMPEVPKVESNASEDKAMVEIDHAGDEVKPTDEGPKLIRSDDLMELWYKPDYKFRLPNAFIYINLISPMGVLSLKDSVRLDLWAEMMRQGLRDELYAADVAGLSYTLQSRDSGLVLRLQGFHQKLPVLVDVVTKMIGKSSDTMEEQLFLAVKDIWTKRYNNIIIKPGKLVRDIRLKLLIDLQWSTLDKLKVIRELQFEDMRTAGADFLQRLRMQILVEGNLLEKDALDVANVAYENLKWKPLPEADRPKPRAYRLPQGETYCCVKSFNPSDANCNVTNLYQADMYTLKDVCIMDLMIMLMEEPLFDTLRTKEQLGYSVYCSVRYTYGVLGFVAVVNSQVDKFSTEHVDERIESFLKGFTNELKKLPERTFQQTKSALIKLKKCAAVELKDDVNRHWNEIESFEQNFNRIAKEVECLKTLTKADIVRWYKKFAIGCKDNTIRKLSVQVIGEKLDDATKAQNQTEEPAPEDFVKCLKYVENEQKDGSDRTFIMDIDSFKNTMAQFPEVEEYLKSMAS